MTRQRYDGSVQSAMTPTPANVGRTEDNSVYRCIVTKVIYVDDPANITANSTNPRVLYDVVVLGGFASGQIISNCRLSSLLGGNSSFYERVLRAADQDVSGSRLSESDGDIVYVEFVQGHTAYPMIVSLDNGIKTSEFIGATLSDGPRLREQYNGVWREINKDGELELQIRGGVSVAEKGKFTPNSDALVTFKTTKDEKNTRTFKSGLKIEEDGKSDKITVTMKGGLTSLFDGTADKATITTAAGAKMEIDGKSKAIKMTVGSTEVLIDGNSGKISLKGDFIDLGSQVEDFVTKFIELATAFNSHAHISALPGQPTSPPTGPLLQTVGSQTVKVQS